MNDLVIGHGKGLPLPASDEKAIDNVKFLEAVSKRLPQVPIHTDHVLHGGMYARTILIPKETVLTGALIKVPTMLIIQGAVIVYMDGVPVLLDGYNCFYADAHRKQAFWAKSDTYVTMVFATSARTVEEAEEQFTDEFNALMSRSKTASNHVTITEET